MGIEHELGYGNPWSWGVGLGHVGPAFGAWNLFMGQGGSARVRSYVQEAAGTPVTGHCSHMLLPDGGRERAHRVVTRRHLSGESKAVPNEGAKA